MIKGKSNLITKDFQKKLQVNNMFTNYVEDPSCTNKRVNL